MKLFSTIALLLCGVSGVLTAGEKVNYDVGGEAFEGYYASPTANAPLVLLVHDWDGLTDYEVKRAEMLAELGYSVFAVDMFGAGNRPADMAGRQKLTGALYNDRPRMRALMAGALEAAKQQGANTGNAVAMGYCFGGSVILDYARSGADLKGFVTFHGGLATPEGQNYAQAKGQILVLHGTADDAVTMDQFAALAKELEGQKIKHEMIAYSGAPHAFTVFGSERYREDADKKSWRRFGEFLEEVLN
ncbi:MAG: dienelactone hydrolase family protein [Gammaproteobacteria bacterium]|nr:MAG: dienelactone hydrolase family protein [Gammaproteobacteria bacterium]